MLMLQAIPFENDPTCQYVDRQPWYQRWASLVLRLKAERVHHEKQITPTPELGMPTPLTPVQENSCRAAYGAMYTLQLWQGRCRKGATNPPHPGDWVHDRMRTSLEAWNATFRDDGGPAPDPNDWNPKTYSAPDLPGMDDPEWGVV